MIYQPNKNGWNDSPLPPPFNAYEAVTAYEEVTVYEELIELVIDIEDENDKKDEVCV